MAITYPTTIDNLTNPSAGNTMAAVPHATQHADANDAIEALEAKVGANSSAVTTSHDYKLGEVTGSDKAVGKTATQTLTNKTLTAPVLNIGSDATGDMYYRNSSGILTRLAIGTSGQILSSDATGIPIWIANPAAADASTTTKGVSEEATLAETLARTAAGGTSARLFVNPSQLSQVLGSDYVADTGSSTAYAIAPTPAITAYVTGQEFRFKAANANTTATPTLAVSGLASPKTIVNPDGTALAIGAIAINQEVIVRYNGTNMVMVSPLNNIRNKISAVVTDVTITNTTTETAILTTSIPANTLRTNNAVRARIFITSLTTASAVTFRFKYGATTLATSNALNVGTGQGGIIEVMLFANAATNAQEGSMYVCLNSTVNAPLADTSTGTSAIDSTSAQNLVVTAQYASNNSTLTMSNAIVELIN